MMECPNRSENLINRKIIKFYIEAFLNFLFRDQKIFFLRSTKKIFFPKMKFLEFFLKSKFWWKFLKIQQCKIFQKCHFWGEKFQIFFANFFRAFFFQSHFFLNFVFRFDYFSCKKSRSFDLWGFQIDPGTPWWHIQSFFYVMAIQNCECSAWKRCETGCDAPTRLWAIHRKAPKIQRDFDFRRVPQQSEVSWARLIALIR